MHESLTQLGQESKSSSLPGFPGSSNYIQFTFMVRGSRFALYIYIHGSWVSGPWVK